MRTAATGLDAARAVELVAHGLGGWVVIVDDLAGAEEAIAAVVAARNETPAQPSVVVEFPAGAPALPGPAACFRWARERGADGAWVCPPYRPLAAAGAGMLAELKRERWPFFVGARDSVAQLGAPPDGAGPGVPRVHGRCPVARRRVEIVADGTIRACPFKAGAATALAALDPHLREVAACDRWCGHVDLV